MYFKVLTTDNFDLICPYHHFTMGINYWYSDSSNTPNGFAIYSINNLYKFLTDGSNIAIITLPENTDIISDGCKVYVKELNITSIVSYAKYDNWSNLIKQSNGWAFEFLPKSHKNYNDLCKLALSIEGCLLQYCSWNHYDYANHCMIAVDQQPLAIKFVNISVITESLCELAVGKNGLALKYIPVYIITLSLCSLAVNQNGLALYYAPRQYLTNELCIDACHNNPNAINYIPTNLITDYIKLVFDRKN